MKISPEMAFRNFYEYLCQVANWRLQNDASIERPGIRNWGGFLHSHSKYFAVGKKSGEETAVSKTNCDTELMDSVRGII